MRSFRLTELSAIAAFLWLRPAPLVATDAGPEQPDGRLYESAFFSPVQGEYLQARDGFDRLIANHPDSPFANQARIRLLRLNRMGLSRSRLGLNQSGREVTLLFGTLYGTWLGIDTAIASDYASDKALTGGMMLGAPVEFLST